MSVAGSAPNCNSRAFLCFHQLHRIVHTQKEGACRALRVDTRCATGTPFFNVLPWVRNECDSGEVKSANSSDRKEDRY